MYNVWHEDWTSADELRTILKLNNTRECLQWFDHVEIMKKGIGKINVELSKLVAVSP